MVVRVYRQDYPEVRSPYASGEEKVGWAIQDLIRGASWTWGAREVVPAPELKTAYVGRKTHYENSVLVEEEIHCSKEEFEATQAWLDALEQAGYWGVPSLVPVIVP